MKKSLQEVTVWKKVVAIWNKIVTIWTKVVTIWTKVVTTWKKVVTNWENVVNVWKKVVTVWNKVFTVWKEVFTVWNKVATVSQVQVEHTASFMPKISILWHKCNKQRQQMANVNCSIFSLISFLICQSWFSSTVVRLSSDNLVSNHLPTILTKMNNKGPLTFGEIDFICVERSRIQRNKVEAEQCCSISWALLKMQNAPRRWNRYRRMLADLYCSSSWE